MSAMQENLHDKNIEEITDPEMHDDNDIDDLKDSIGQLHKGTRGTEFLESGDSPLPGDVGASGDVGLEEIATAEEMEREAGESRDARRVPSDLQDSGDPNAWDVGIPGGVGSGDPDGGEFEPKEDGEIPF
jgi:hypothetical protein